MACNGPLMSGKIFFGEKHVTISAVITLTVLCYREWPEEKSCGGAGKSLNTVLAVGRT